MNTLDEVLQEIQHEKRIENAIDKHLTDRFIGQLFSLQSRRGGSCEVDGRDTPLDPPSDH